MLKEIIITSAIFTSLLAIALCFACLLTRACEFVCRRNLSAVQYSVAIIFFMVICFAGLIYLLL